ncbi:MAG: Bug family tripartite tricarboxylate transporter substrate binding protein [Lautropia sp.]
MKSLLWSCSRNTVLCMFSLLAMGAAVADDYPQKPLNFIVSSGAGGAVDSVARIIGEKLTAKFKQPVVVQAKPGATGSIAARAVLAAPADGYTALFSSAFFHAALHVMKEPGYKPEDFVGVSKVASPAIVLVVNSNSDHKTLTDLLDFARKPGNSVNYGAVGVGSGPHLSGEALRIDSKAALRQVSYKSEPHLVTDILGNNLDAGILSFTAVQPMIESGRLRPLSIVGNQRHKLLPGVPTFAELGFPRVNRNGWFGILLPAGTPKARVDTLSAAVQEIVAEPQMKARLEDLGYQPVGDSTETFTAFLRRDAADYGQILREAGIRLE